MANEFVQDQSFADVVYSNLILNTPAAFMGCNQNRGVHAAGFFVTKWPFVPSILVEVCFISNQCQQNRIRQGGNQGLVASGIAAGITQVIFPGGVAGGEQAWAISEVAPGVPWERRAEGAPLFQAHAAQAYGEAFDGPSFPPSGWTVTSAGQPAPHLWSRNTDPVYVHSGVGAAVVGGASAGAVDEWLISPHLFIGPADRGLSFYWLGNRTWATQVNAECLIRPVGTATWTQLWSLLGEGSGQEFAYPNRTVDVSPWLGDSIQFAFRVAGTNGADFGIDDIVIGDLDPAPGAPVNETCASAIALPAGSFEFSGSTCAAADNLDPYHANSFSCALDQLSGGDVFYRVVAQAGDSIAVNIAGDWQAAVYVMSACDTVVTSCAVASPILELSDTSSVASLTHVFAAGGTYYLGVDGVLGECGQFHMTGYFSGSVTGVGDGIGPATIRLTASPNPARNGVTLAGGVHVQNVEQGTISVFDAAGRRVWQSPIGVSAGRFSITWDGQGRSGSRLASGTYLVRVEIAGETAKTSVILLE